MKVSIVCGDITSFNGDVVVNAANPVMLGGGGVDGAIHRAAGPGLRAACRNVPGEEQPGGTWAHLSPGESQPNLVRCLVGQVRPTPAFDLLAKWVFHTVGPIFALQRAGELRPGEAETQVEDPQQDPVLRQQLRDCYKKAMLLAVAMDLKTLAVPAISCGVYGCTHETCADVFMKVVADHAAWPVEFTVFLYPADSFPIWVAAARKYGVEGF